MSSQNEKSPIDKAVAPAQRAPVPKAKSGTTPAVTQPASPRLPHEHDESADSQASEEPREVMKQAKKDLDGGLVDTDRGPVVHELYEAEFRADDPLPAVPEKGHPKVGE